jgi:hypothetical protein
MYIFIYLNAYSRARVAYVLKTCTDWASEAASRNTKQLLVDVGGTSSVSLAGGQSVWDTYCRDAPVRAAGLPLYAYIYTYGSSSMHM